MTERRRLPNRRRALTFEIEVGGLRYTCTVGRFADGRPAEIFISNHKRRNAADVAARDAGILVSLLLQHDCGIEIIARAISRDSNGSASGVIGAVLDKIIEMKRALDALADDKKSPP
jgi:hypothetical protein